MIAMSSILQLIRPAADSGRQRLDRRADVDLLFELGWHSESVSHTDCLFQQGLNLWRDQFPPALEEALLDTAIGERVAIDFGPDRLVPAARDTDRFQVEAQSFRPPLYRNLAIRPAMGRFYPRRFIAGTRDIDPHDTRPMRVTGVGDRLGIDISHPLASRHLSLSAAVVAGASTRAARGGLCRDVAERVAHDGPGMQARWRNTPTDFWSGEPFARGDASPDRQFYARPRLVSHIDRTASAVIAELYRQWITDGARVLDLMASWDSHLPATRRVTQLIGLGMNEEELAHNARMDDYRVHDLNDDSRLPFESGSFDAVICTVSMEYLVKPFEVVAEVARVLKPGGRFIVTFSNRWFPPKAVRIWELLHDYERVGMVLEYFLRNGSFSGLHSWSLRGLPRPEDDKYADRLSLSDPVYAVCGIRCGPDGDAAEEAPD
jgi:SAM-dependent methyltransferase